MKKLVTVLIVAVIALSCRFFTPSVSTEEPKNDNICYSELNLTDEECNNVGTHTYKSSITIEGIGGTECTSEDGNYISDYRTYKFSFLDGNLVEYAHPDELIWDEYTHTFSEISKNTYQFSGVSNDMQESWMVTFFSWGFEEELKLTWDCTAGTCGCITTGTYDLSD